MNDHRRDAPHLLVVDDDARLRALLQRFLSEQGFRVTAAADAAAARRALAAMAFDLLVLDVMMPGESGLRAGRIAAPRRQRRADADADRARRAGRPHRGLRARRRRLPGQALRPARAGAAHPHHPAPRRAAAAPPRCAQAPVQLGPRWFDPERSELRGPEGIVRLTGGEAALLRRAGRAAPGEVLSREEIAAALGTPEAGERAIDVQVTRLRRKIEPDPREPRFIQTVRHRGYVLRPGP